MTALKLDARPTTAFRFAGSMTWWDAEIGCTILMAPPSAEPQRWAEYLDGARDCYRRFGVECALDFDELRTGGDTAFFFAALDPDGRMVAGVRAKGPLRSADDSHAVVEWAGQPGLAAVRKMINDRVPFGVLEMKAAWVKADRERSASLATTLARSGFWAMALSDIRFGMATSAAHVLERWSSSGGIVAPIPAAPYPDKRYQTKMMWWDLRTFAKHAEPEQASKTFSEMAHVVRLADRDTSALMHSASI